MTKEEAKDFLFNMFDLIGTTAIEHWTEKDAEKMRQAVLAIENESAQPEPCEDAVSRQAIIDTAAEYEKQLCEILGDENELVKVVKILKHRLIALPFTQPEQKIGKIVRWMEIRETPDHISYTPHRKCSLCGNELLSDNIDYCYICGVRLIEDREAEGRFE